jgi:hypothetical protein
LSTTTGVRARILALVVFALAAVVFAAGCTANVDPPAPRSAPLDGAAYEQAEIYSAVIRQQYADDTGGGHMDKPIVYIVGHADDSLAEGMRDSKTAPRIPDEVRARISASLADLGSEIRWVERSGDVRRHRSSGQVVGGGVVVSVGVIKRRGADLVHVPSSIYIANLGAGGQTYVLKKVGGRWRVTGTTGSQWIS